MINPVKLVDVGGGEGELREFAVGDKLPAAVIPEVDKSVVGLANVDNTSDADKPVSVAQQLALDDKVDKIADHSLVDDLQVAKLSALRTNDEADLLLGGKVGTGDSRLTDAREWSAATIPQDEVEDGTATTRRAFTAQRLRQGITAWYTGISGALGRTILGRGTAEQVRGDLELGTAATATLTTSKVDPIEGRVPRSGDYGIGSVTFINQTGWDTLQPAGIYRGSNNQEGKSPAYPGGVGVVLNASQDQNTRQMLMFTGSYEGSPAAIGVRVLSNAHNGDWTYMYHTGNTTKNPDGTLKASSPVINLYTDKHDLHNEGQFGATPTVVRKSKGVYEITGTLGLRSEGWYLDTPSDRNGNKYFNIEWTQNITPDTADGVVDEYRDDIVVTIETFERVWNKDTGLFENGDPIDINELQDRFVQLRFNEVVVKHEEPSDDSVSIRSCD